MPQRARPPSCRPPLCFRDPDHQDQIFWDDIEEEPRSLDPLGLQQGVHPCDKRRSVSEYQFLFSAVDFSLIDSDEDIWWKANVRETKEELATKGIKFMNWLWTRNEKEIANVTHSGILFHTLNIFENYCNPLVKKEISSNFANCELCSMVIVDRSMTGSIALTTNYPGKIPPGLDLPSDLSDEKLSGEAPARPATKSGGLAN
ncbi:phosphoglycerate mutase-like protein 1 [Arachis stenosperma]|uniref:phosphoglycerate mutase-like protein 1 n=1 Tax=Arachis stenosperma TaxID=217475 RepID=UPI0025AC8080|nr:phosphoglycerate mutase-like protein 1 [Arachis stenosperma]